HPCGSGPWSRVPGPSQFSPAPCALRLVHGALNCVGGVLCLPASLPDPVPDPVPADVAQEAERAARLGVPRVVDEDRAAAYVLARHEAPEAAVLGLVAVVAEHEVVA